VKHKPQKKWVISDSQFQHWDNVGVSKARQKRTYIAIANQPHRRDVRHVVFTLSGQQYTPVLGIGEHSTRLTGQKMSWWKEFEDDSSVASIIDTDIDETALPYQIMSAWRMTTNTIGTYLASKGSTTKSTRLFCAG
jgi:hypothetical protein